MDQQDERKKIALLGVRNWRIGRPVANMLGVMGISSSLMFVSPSGRSFTNDTISMMITSIYETVQIHFYMTILNCFLKIPTIRSVTPFVQWAVAVLNSH